MKLLTNKKGSVFGELAALATGIAVLAIVLVVTFLIISQGRSQICTIEGLTGDCTSNASSLAVNATNTLAGAVDDIPSWIPLVVIASIGAILLGLVAMFRKR